MGMTLKAVIDQVNAIKPNAFSEEQKTEWINEVEKKIQAEIFLFGPAQTIVYTWPQDQNTELLADPLHDGVYPAYLTARIDFANGEYNRYANTLQMFNTQYIEFMRWFAQHYRPADRWEDQ